MIEQGVFRSEWTALCERFRLTGQDEPSQLMARRYYHYLSSRISTEEFREAVEVVYAEREFFPKPVDFVEAVEPDRDEEALSQWQLVRHAMENTREGLPGEVTEATRRLVDSEGGLRRLGMMDLSDVAFVKNRFLRDYGTQAQSEERRDKLPPMSEDGRELMREAVPRLVGEG